MELFIKVFFWYSLILGVGGYSVALGTGSEVTLGRGGQVFALLLSVVWAFWAYQLTYGLNP